MDEKRQLFKQIVEITQDVRKQELRNKHRFSQFRGGGEIIRVLSESKAPICQNNLAKLASVRPGSLSQTLGRLERDEIIHRERSESDRRQIKVSLTPKGQKLNKEMLKDRDFFINAVLSKLTVEDLKEMVRFSTLIRDGIQDYYDKGGQTIHD